LRLLTYFTKHLYHLSSNLQLNPLSLSVIINQELLNLSSSARDIVTVDLCGGCNFVNERTWKQCKHVANLVLGCNWLNSPPQILEQQREILFVWSVCGCYNFRLPHELLNIGQSERSVQMKKRLITN